MGIMHISNQLKDHSLSIVYVSLFFAALAVSVLYLLISLRLYWDEIKEKIYRQAVDEVKKEMVDGHIELEQSA